MQKFNLVQKRNPAKPDAPKKWYAVPQTREAQSIKAMTRSATENTSTAPIEMEAALDLLGKYATEQLLQGHTVKVGDLGTLRITFKSDGVENINDFNAGVMIKEPRILFTPSKEFRQNIIQQLKYQNPVVAALKAVKAKGRILRYNSLPERDAELHEVGLLKSR